MTMGVRLPIIEADVAIDSASVRVEGSVSQSLPADGRDIREVVLRFVIAEAQRRGADVELVTSGVGGDRRLRITPDGDMFPLAVGDAPPADLEVDDPDSHGTPPGPRRGSDPAGWAAAAPQVAAASDSGRPATRREARVSFITPTETPFVEERSGWRKALGMGPSSAERARAQDARDVARQWRGVRRVAVVNGKGGVGKTMTTAMLAAVFGRYGGSGVLAWDNNPTRGTLGWRTEGAGHDATVQDLLRAARGLLSRGGSPSELADFVHRHTVDKYDVLRSNPELLASHQAISREDFDLLNQVAERFFRLVIFDSGNDESADRWQRMIEVSNQLVVPTIATRESAESAALLLDELAARDTHSARLAASAVVVVTLPRAGGKSSRAWEILDAFRKRSRAVHFVPYDPALDDGPLYFSALRSHTQGIWLSVAADVARGL